MPPQLLFRVDNAISEATLESPKLSIAYEKLKSSIRSATKDCTTVCILLGISKIRNVVGTSTSKQDALSEFEALFDELDYPPNIVLDFDEIGEPITSEGRLLRTLTSFWHSAGSRRVSAVGSHEMGNSTTSIVSPGCSAQRLPLRNMFYAVWTEC